jgi:hypothetical protein
MYLSFFQTKQYLKTRTPLGRLLTSTKVWAQQPRADEPAIAPVPAPVSSAVSSPGLVRS